MIVHSSLLVQSKHPDRASEVAPKRDLQGSVADVSPQRMTIISLWSNLSKQDAHIVSCWQLLATHIQ